MSLVSYPGLLFTSAYLYNKHKCLYCAVSLPLTAQSHFELIIWNDIYFHYESHNEHDSSLNYVEVNGHYTIQPGDLHDKRTPLGN